MSKGTVTSFKDRFTDLTGLIEKFGKGIALN